MSEMSREQWLEERTKGLGATDCANIIVNSANQSDRIGCWKGSLFSMWSTKMKLTPAGGASSSAARRGQIMEEYVCRMYQDHLGPGAKLIAQGLTWHPKRKHIFGTPDRLIELDGVRFGMDAKTRRSSRGWGHDGGCAVPLDTEVQCRVYMDIFDVPYWDIAALFGLDDFRVYRLHRDQDLINDILGVCEEWFEKHVDGETPPMVDGSDRAKDAISRMHPREESDILRTPTGHELDIHKELLSVREEHKSLSTRKLKLENQLREAIADDVGIEGVATWKASKGRESFDSKALKEADPDLYKKYTKTTPGNRTLRIIGESR
jgi:predicted phage-related endonuclease